MLLPCHRNRVGVRHLAMGSGMVTRCLVPEARTWVLAVGLPCSAVLTLGCWGRTHD